MFGYRYYRIGCQYQWKWVSGRLVSKMTHNVSCLTLNAVFSPILPVEILKSVCVEKVLKTWWVSGFLPFTATCFHYWRCHVMGDAPSAIPLLKMVRQICYLPAIFQIQNILTVVTDFFSSLQWRIQDFGMEGAGTGRASKARVTRRRRRPGVEFGKGVSPPPMPMGFGRGRCPYSNMVLILCLEMVQFCEYWVLSIDQT